MNMGIGEELEGLSVPVRGWPVYEGLNPEAPVPVGAVVFDTDPVGPVAEGRNPVGPVPLGSVVFEGIDPVPVEPEVEELPKGTGVPLGDSVNGTGGTYPPEELSRTGGAVVSGKLWVPDLPPEPKEGEKVDEFPEGEAGPLMEAVIRPAEVDELRYGEGVSLAMLGPSVEYIPMLLLKNGISVVVVNPSLPVRGRLVSEKVLGDVELAGGVMTPEAAVPDPKPEMTKPLPPEDPYEDTMAVE